MIKRAIDFSYHNDTLRYFIYFFILLALYVLISSHYRITTQFFIGYGAMLFMFIATP
ncbi:MAG: hypothetical protein Q9M39_01045 [Sulfurovum sp.]|nr:hypothetical protein [Sulfurovum sp.]